MSVNVYRNLPLPGYHLDGPSPPLAPSTQNVSTTRSTSADRATSALTAESEATHGCSCLAAVPLEAGDLGVFEHLSAPRVALAHAERHLVELDGYNAGHPRASRRCDGRVAQTGAGVEDSARRRRTHAHTHTHARTHTHENTQRRRQSS